MSKTRLEAFTDAVIAIIMTVLVLELVRPDSDSLQSFYCFTSASGCLFCKFFYTGYLLGQSPSSFSKHQKN